MQPEIRFVEGICEYCKYLLLDILKVCLVELILEP
jgi:hypothetical protein